MRQSFLSYTICLFERKALINHDGLILIFYREKRDEEVVCYSDVGCFWDDGPFDYLDMLPSNPDEVGTTMQLFTRKNREKAQLIGTVLINN